MTDTKQTTHSIKELKRQYDDARSMVYQARNKERDAMNAYHAALILQKERELSKAGKPVGSRVRAFRRGDVVGEYFVHSVECKYGYTEIMLAKIKKDGTPYASPSRIWFDTLEPVNKGDAE